jgi:metallo-beta-lactamase family protein
MSVKLKFLGGVRTVTGSSHLLHSERSDVLIDAGIFYGRRDEFYEVNTTFSYNPKKLDAVLLSHAHIDHCGNIPSLIKRGLRCKIYATSATKDLCKLMLADSGKVQKEDIRYVNKINKRLGLALRKPLYTENEGYKATRRFRSLSYAQKFNITKDVCATFYDAGHILGAGLIYLEIKDNSSVIRLGYAVDLGRKNLPLLNNPTVLKGLDYLILESTYGARLHAPIEEAKAKLCASINQTLESKGKIIIPSFALERTQEVIYYLGQLIEEKKIPALPIYVDSPLAADITEVFNQHIDYFNPQTRQAIVGDSSPLKYPNLKYIRNQEESKNLNNDRRPMIIIAGSGMCESGRILHHLKNNIEDSRNTILVVGFMAQDTLGRKLVEGQRIVRIFGVEYELNAEVVVINSFSGHADRSGLLEYAQACQPLKKIFIVHGDQDQSQKLCAALSGAGLNAYLPSKDEEVDLS